MRKACLCFFLAWAAAPSGALDYGLVVRQEAELSNEAPDSAGAGNAGLFHTPEIGPWVSGPLGESFRFYLSGKAGFEYFGKLAPNSDARDSGWRDPAALPELERSELVWLVSPELCLTLGRQRFRDASGLAASGLFDGLRAELGAGGGRFSLGGYYTGLLYKDTADIIMSGRDRQEYGKPFALDNSYFASRRGLASLEWENPSLGESSSLALGVLAQFDLNEEENARFHSQYLSARYGLRLPLGLGLEASAAPGMGEDQGGNAQAFFAGALGLEWRPPGSLDQALSLGGVYSSPARGRRLAPFIPVSSSPLGQVFAPSIGGVSALKGAYALRPGRTLSLGLECSWFLRSDTVSFQDDREPDRLKAEGYFLGMECYASAQWTPLPDLALVSGGGAFFPRMGNAFAAEAEIRWKAMLGLILSL
jgi:hypothetical protein